MDQGPSGARSAAAEQRPPAVPGEVEKAERAARRAQDAPVAPRTLPPAPRRAHSGRRAPASPAAWSCADPRGPELARRCGRPRGAVRGARGRPPAHSDRCPATARPVCHALPLRTTPAGPPSSCRPRRRWARAVRGGVEKGAPRGCLGSTLVVETRSKGLLEHLPPAESAPTPPSAPLASAWMLWLGAVAHLLPQPR